jgi:voltage-gated sodium channel
MLKKLFLNEKFILLLIILNAVIIFISGFKFDSDNKFILSIMDNMITALFVIEVIIKINTFGIKGYFSSNWNRFDFVLIVLSVPSFITFIANIEISHFSYFLVFRVLRVFKSLRFIKFVPGVEHLIKGVTRALKSSVIVLIGFIVYIFIISVFSFYLFNDISKEYYGDPLNALYSTFKIFTVEGWYEIPEYLTQQLSPTASFFTYIYFIFVVVSGGILGLSLVNSIFVDAMVSDNNDDLEKKIDELSGKIDSLLNKSKIK